MSGMLPPVNTRKKKRIPHFPEAPQKQLYWFGRLLYEVCAEAASEVADNTDRWRHFGEIKRQTADEMIEALRFAQKYANRPIVSDLLRNARTEVHHYTKHRLVDLFAWLRQAIENAINEDDITTGSRRGPVPLDGRILTTIIEAAELASKILAKRATSAGSAPTKVINMAQQINIRQTNVTQQTDIPQTNIHVTVTPGPKNEPDSKLKDKSPKKKAKTKRQKRNPSEKMTARQTKVWVLHQRGRTLREIANDLGVKSHSSISGVLERAQKVFDRQNPSGRSVRDSQSLPTGKRGEPLV